MQNISVTTDAQPVHWPAWSDNVIIDNTVTSGLVVYVSTDGSTASTTNYDYIVGPGQVAIVPNMQPRLNGLQAPGSGGMTDAVGVTAQSRPASLWASGYPTYVSIAGSDSGTIGVDQR